MITVLSFYISLVIYKLRKGYDDTEDNDSSVLFVYVIEQSRLMFNVLHYFIATQ